MLLFKFCDSLPGLPLGEIQIVSSALVVSYEKASVMHDE